MLAHVCIHIPQARALDHGVLLEEFLFGLVRCHLVVVQGLERTRITLCFVQFCCVSTLHDLCIWVWQMVKCSSHQGVDGCDRGDGTCHEQTVEPVEGVGHGNSGSRKRLTWQRQRRCVTLDERHTILELPSWACVLLTQFIVMQTKSNDVEQKLNGKVEHDQIVERFERAVTPTKTQMNHLDAQMQFTGGR